MEGQQDPAGWRKSRRSASGNCVELRFGRDVVGMRNSRDIGIVLTFDRSAFEDFLKAVRRGEFDLR